MGVSNFEYPYGRWNRRVIERKFNPVLIVYPNTPFAILVTLSSLVVKRFEVSKRPFIWRKLKQKQFLPCGPNDRDGEAQFVRLVGADPGKCRISELNSHEGGSLPDGFRFVNASLNAMR